MSMDAEIIDAIEKDSKKHIKILIQYLRDGEDIRNDLGRALAHLAKMGKQQLIQKSAVIHFY